MEYHAIYRRVWPCWRCFLLQLNLHEVNYIRHVFARVCLSVCLLARLLKNLDEMLRVDKCWNMDELINF